MNLFSVQASRQFRHLNPERYSNLMQFGDSKLQVLGSLIEAEMPIKSLKKLGLIKPALATIQPVYLLVC